MKVCCAPLARVEFKAALCLCVAVSALSTGVGQTAEAQSSDGDETSRLETVVVSGTKREQTLQDTPVAISVVSGDEIERAEIQDLNDLQTLVPSLTIRQQQSSTNTSFFIRGFGNGANAIGLEPSVGIFIDGVYRSRAAATIPDLPNLERVEVLRGPQSTLFGKNASAGVISVVTREPQFETAGSIEAGIGNYNLTRVKGDVTGPISETLAYSLSGTYNKRDGYAEDLGTGEDYNERDRFGIRGELLFRPNDDLTFRLIADLDEIDELCCALTNIVEGPTGAAVRALGGNFVSEDPFAYEVFFDIAPTNEIENSGLSLQADYDIGQAVLTSISAIRRSDSVFQFDPDATSLELFSSNLSDNRFDTFTQEVRLTSKPSDSRFDWIIGGYYFDETVDVENALFFGDDYRNFLNVLVGNPMAISGLETFAQVPAGSLAQSGQGTMEVITQDNIAWSLFASVDVHLTDRLTATFGANYTEDEKDVSMDVLSTDALAAVNLDQLGYNATLANLLAAQGVNILDPASVGPFVQGNPALYGQLQQQSLAVAQSDNNPFNMIEALQLFPPFLNFPNEVEPGKSNDSDTTYKLRLAYDATDNLNFYAGYATGFKATSWNLQRQSRPSSADFVAGNPVFDPVTQQQLAFTPSSPVTDAGLFSTNLLPGTRFAGPEQSEVYEVGVKGTFDTFTFALAIFDQTIDNFQTTIFVEDGFVFANADQQSTAGVELDAVWTPIAPLTLTFAGAFLDGEYDSFPNFGDGINISGQTPAGVPDTQITLGGTFNFRVRGMGAFARADWQYVGDSAFFDDPLDEAAVRAAGYSREENLVNASAGITTKNDIAIAIWARNLFDDEFLVGASPSAAQAGSYNGIPNQPRTFGVTVRKTF